MNDSSSVSSDEDSGDIVSEEIRKVAENISLNLMPQKSKMLYTAAYNCFKKWRKENGSNSFCEDVLLAYFSALASKYAVSSLWSTYSMLKSTIEACDKIDISKYNRLRTFLKRKNKGYMPKKSSVFTKENISQFLSQAPHELFLSEKVALIFGIAGAMRRSEFIELEVKDVKNVDNELLLVNIRKTKNYKPRSFTIIGALYELCINYMQVRSKIELQRFFVRYYKGICYSQPIGINKFAAMPREIASYLNLPDSMTYTGHSFRRTSATLLVDAGADLLDLKRHGGWDSDTAAAGYIAESLANKNKISNLISSGIKVKGSKLFGTLNNLDKLASTSALAIPSTSKQIKHFTPVKLIENHSHQVQSQNTNRYVAFETNTTSSAAVKIPSISRTPPTSNAMQEIPPSVQSFPVFYNPDFGLYVQDLQNNSFVFHNSNVTINNSHWGSFVFHNCNVECNGKTTEDEQ